MSRALLGALDIELGVINMLESLAKPENAAAVLSAVAACFSAFAAYFSWRTQRQTLLHTFRPEIDLTSWKRLPNEDSSFETLSFGTVRNTGRDTARWVVVHAFGLADDDRPTYVLSHYSLPRLLVGEEIAAEGQIQIYWNNVPKHTTGSKMLPIVVTARCWDSLGIRHAATLSLMAFQDPNSPVGGAARVAPGVYLSSYGTKSVPVWRLRLFQRLAKLPLLGKRFANDA